jgi:hypothetical protein
MNEETPDKNNKIGGIKKRIKGMVLATEDLCVLSFRNDGILISPDSHALCIFSAHQRM